VLRVLLGMRERMVELGVLKAPSVVRRGKGDERGLAPGELEQRWSHRTRIAQCSDRAAVTGRLGISSLAADGEHAELIRRRRFPVVGGGGGVWSFIHIDDAAEATVAAVERGRRGIYNIVDDEPAAVAEWLPAVAAALGARRPRRVPRAIGRLLAGEAATVMMTEVRGASNAKAKAGLGWQPRRASWREGFAEAAAA
jgi:nucleoside-diphosphate-sugar epimerase